MNSRALTIAVYLCWHKGLRAVRPVTLNTGQAGLNESGHGRPFEVAVAGQDERNERNQELGSLTPDQLAH